MATADPLGGDIPINSANPYGHHESAALVAANEQLLAWAASQWDRPFLLRPNWEAPESLALLETLKPQLQCHTQQALWIDKDPRLCLTRDALSHVLLRDLPAIAVMRHPLAVAQSLHQRDGFSLKRAAAIWILYNLHLFNCHSQPPQQLLLFEQLTSKDPSVLKVVAERVARFVDHLNQSPAGEQLVAKLATELLTRRQPSLLRSTELWHRESDRPLAEQLQAIWQQLLPALKANRTDLLATGLRHAWADLAPMLEEEVSIPIRPTHGAATSPEPKQTLGFLAKAKSRLARL